ncbi:MAG: DUF1294 domain-containing protein [Bacteroidales bacterium]|nr:DUF1294 domain-containing protein [Bacteroidales bacterium]
MVILAAYFALINLVAGITFFCDKRRALSHKYRIPEFALHVLEFLGGVFAVVALMFIIRHKNRKFSYFAISFLILLAWIYFLYWLGSNSADFIIFADKIIK